MNLPGVLRRSRSHREAVARIAKATVYRWRIRIIGLGGLNRRSPMDNLSQYVRPLHGVMRTIGWEYNIVENVMVVDIAASDPLIAKPGVCCERMERVAA